MINSNELRELKKELNKYKPDSLKYKVLKAKIE